MKRVVLASVISVLIIASIAVGYFYYQQVKSPSLEAINAIPPDASIIIDIRNMVELNEKLQKSEIWKSLNEIPELSELNDEFTYLDSCLKANNELLAHISSYPLLISVHAIKANKPDVVLYMNLPRFNQESFVNDMLQKFSTVELNAGKRTYEGVVIREIKYGNAKTSFSYTVSKGLFIGSHTAFLVEDAIRQLKTGQSFKSEKAFSKVYESAGKLVDANVYVNYRNIGRFMNIFASDANLSSIRRAFAFSSWSEFDLKLRPDIIMLNGLSTAFDSTKFLYSISSQTPVALNISTIAPKRTAMFVSLGLSKPSEYFSKLGAYQNAVQLSSRMTMIDQVNKKYKIDLTEQLTSWVDQELAYLITEASSVNYNNNAFVLARVKEPQSARKALRTISEAIAKDEKTQVKEELYKGFVIGYLSISQCLSSVYGPMFEKIDKPFYTIIGNFVVYSNQASSLRAFIDDNVNAKTLSTDPSYRAFAENVTSTSNCYMYLNVQRSSYILKSLASENTYKFIEKYADVLQKFDAIAYQASSSTGLVNNLILARYSKQKMDKDVDLLWAAQLDTSVSKPPIALINSTNNNYDIAVQDDANNLYLLDNSGEILWKKPLTEPILGTIQQIDLFKNGKLQLIFNTPTKLYVIDRNGAYVGNYPIRLPAEATTGIAVFDYDKNRDYRIFVACANKMVYVYQSSGKPVAGWGFNKPIGDVTHPVQHFVAGGKDYLLLSDDNGKTYMLDRRGEKRTEVKGMISRAANSQFTLENSSSNFYFVVTDTAGNIYSLFPDGSIQTKTVRTFNADHTFLFEDNQKLDKRNYIFLDSNTLEVYDRDNTLVFGKAFDKDILHSLRYFPAATGPGTLGIVAATSNEIYLIQNDGSFANGWPLKGSTPFQIIDLNSDGNKNVIVGSYDGNVYVYTME